jgi:2,3-bisphosphoglycerate-independent phosphoglycerate mutase
LRPNELDAIVESNSQKSEPLTFNAKTLNELVWESVDEVLNGLIGKKPTEAVYDYLERRFSIARGDIPQNTEKLFDVMKGLFGLKSSTVISRCIAKGVFENLGWEFVQVEGFGFSDYIEMARARIARELIQKAKTLGT